MPSDITKVDPNVSDPNLPVGSMVRFDKLPEPYDSEVNEILNKLRAQLLGMCELSMQSTQLGQAKKNVRHYTIEATNSFRNIILKALSEK